MNMQQYMNTTGQTRKRGVGIMEVMVAALVLGLLFAAVSNLQKGNRDALLRIRGRDGATEVAQNIIDSLSSIGLATLLDAKLGTDESGAKKDMEIKDIKRVWVGQPGLVPNNMEVKYDAKITFSDDITYRVDNTTQYTQNAEEAANQKVSHVYAKKVDVKVSWHYKSTVQSITVSGVIR